MAPESYLGIPHVPMDDQSECDPERTIPSHTDATLNEFLTTLYYSKTNNFRMSNLLPSPYGVYAPAHSLRRPCQAFRPSD